MHRQLKELLPDAEGQAEFIIAVNLDIRGFTSFSGEVESPETAVFIKRVYLKILDDYFPDVSYFKPTGDGLLVVLPYTENNLEQVVPQTVQTCLRLHDDFGTFCEQDPMINFAVPQKLGIGLARGSACCLVSGDKTIDYSGRILNLVSRLQDIARPSGIVFDASFGIELLSPEVMEEFESEAVYLKGIAETQPVDVFFTKQHTHIAGFHKRPIGEARWQKVESTLPFAEVKEMTGGHWGFDLPSKPMDAEKIQVTVKYPAPREGLRERGFTGSFRTTEHQLDQEGQQHTVC